MNHVQLRLQSTCFIRRENSDSTNLELRYRMKYMHAYGEKAWLNYAILTYNTLDSTYNAYSSIMYIL